MFGAVRSGSCPDLAKAYSQRGRRSASGAKRAIVLQVSVSGITGLPQSRPWENDQSKVAISPTAPAARARSIRWRISSRVPTQ